MSLFRKIFGKKNEDSPNPIKSEERGKYMPEIKLPIDERFTINFKANGGKFLYSENIDEVYQNLNLILQENNWSDKNVLIIDDRLKDHFKNVNADHLWQVSARFEFGEKYIPTPNFDLINTPSPVLATHL